MTVCVAAMCQGPLIICAADRMITAGDVEFEPAQSKIFNLTTSIVAMTAGDSALQSEVLQDVYADINQRIRVEPNNWWNVKDVAELYVHHYNRLRCKRAESTILAPLGLTQNTFIGRQSEMANQFVLQVSGELAGFQTSIVEVIICGQDSTGLHVYVVENGWSSGRETTLTCRDSVGFASIGLGSGHANSQFMFAGHTRMKPFPQTFLLTLSAKKRAEVAPGVGKATDMVIVGPLLGRSTAILPKYVDDLEKIYNETQEKIRQVEKEADESIDQHVKKQLEEAATKAQAAPLPTSSSTATEPPSSQSPPAEKP